MKPTTGAVSLRLAENADDIAACWPVLRLLRPQLDTVDALLAYVEREGPNGYRLLVALVAGEVAGVAGWRIQENLIYGRHVYVDDLIVWTRMRGRRIGADLLAFLRSTCGSLGIERLTLDAAESNLEAHRFYEKEGMAHGARKYVISV